MDSYYRFGGDDSESNKLYNLDNAHQLLICDVCRRERKELAF